MADEASRATRLVLALSLLGAGLWLLAIFLAPVLQSRDAGRAASLIYAVFSPTCHQIPDRCFSLQGYPMAVCGRCLGVYLGFLAGLLAYPFIRGFSKLELPHARTFLLFSAPIGVDGLAGILGIWASPIGLRLATGSLWGTVLPFYFITGVAGLIVERRARRGGRGPAAPPARQPADPDVAHPPGKSVE